MQLSSSAAQLFSEQLGGPNRRCVEDSTVVTMRLLIVNVVATSLHPANRATSSCDDQETWNHQINVDS